MYAQLCKRLLEEAPNFEPPDKPSTFLIHLLNRCKTEFDKRPAVAYSPESSQYPSYEQGGGQNDIFSNNYNSGAPQFVDEEDRRQFAKRKMLGNMKFIGELGKLEILHHSILHRCIVILLSHRDPEDLECLCQIMRTCGRILDTVQGQRLMSQYFDRMKLLSADVDLPPRIRFLLQDIIDLRQDNWMPRNAAIVQGPMPIHQLRPNDNDLIEDRYFGTQHSPMQMNNSSFYGQQQLNQSRSGSAGAKRMAGTSGPFNRQEHFGVSDMLRSGILGSSISNNSGGSQQTLSSELFRHQIKTRTSLEDIFIGGAGNAGGMLGSFPNNSATNSLNGQRGSTNVTSSSNLGFNLFNSNNTNNSTNNSQRGLYKHNSHNNNSQFNNQSGKELGPRFKKSLILQKDNINDVELRPNTMLITAFAANSVSKAAKPASMMNNTNRSGIDAIPSTFPTPAYASAAKSTPPPLLKEVIPIKQISADKPKQPKKDKGPSKDELLKKFKTLLEEFYRGEHELKQVLHTYKEYKVPDKFAKDVICSGITMVLDKSNAEQEKFVQLLSSLREDNCVTLTVLHETFKSLGDILEEYENSMKKAKSKVSKNNKNNKRKDASTTTHDSNEKNVKSDTIVVHNDDNNLTELKTSIKGDNENANRITNAAAVILSNAIIENLFQLTDLAQMTENGAHFPLLLLVLQQLHHKLGKKQLTDLFNSHHYQANASNLGKSKINLLTQLPENEQTKERLSELLENYDLTFLYPLLRIQAELVKQLRVDHNPQSFMKWIKEHVDTQTLGESGFINVVVSVLAQFICEEVSKENCTILGNEAVNAKGPEDREVILLKRYRLVLRALLDNKLHLQLVALYAIQVHFHSLGFPRGHLFKWFTSLYEFNIVPEEAFLRWKEEVTDAYPGKGKALFEVNQWLTWLQNTESEEEEEEDEDD